MSILVERDGLLCLTLEKKRQILLNNIYGVDLDPQAVEVAQLSLYLKLLEDETTCPVALRDFAWLTGGRDNHVVAASEDLALDRNLVVLVSNAEFILIGAQLLFAIWIQLLS